MSSRSASTAPDTFDIAIAGAGPVGLTLALALARREFTVALIDTGASPAPGRAFLVAAGCWRIWRALGLDPALSQAAEPVLSVTAGAGFGDIAFLPGDAGEGPALGYMIEEAPLVEALAAAVDAESGVTRLTPARLEQVHINSAWVMPETATDKLRARLLIGCDGRRSLVRSAADIRYQGRDYDANALSAILRLDAPHHGEARQIFLKTGPIAALPLKGQRINLVWTHRGAVADVLANLSDADFEAELAKAADGFLNDFRLDGPRHVFPVGVRVADRLHGERIALAGDSAHLVHPLAGQGLNLGLKDAAALVDVIAGAAHVGLDIGSASALAPYTRWRRPDIVASAAAMDAFHSAFTGPAPIRVAAGMALGAAGGASWLRVLFARDAAAQGGDAPSLMQA